jgi:AbrB family looped-hinge helix DNA binding protein
MPNLSIKVNTRNQITIPKRVREKLNIKVGDHLLVDVQGNIMVLLPKAANYTDHLHGLYSEIWNNIDIEKYLNDEHEAW